MGTGQELARVLMCPEEGTHLATSTPPRDVCCLAGAQNASAPGEDDANNGPTGVNADFSAVTTAPSTTRKPMTRAPAFMRRPCGVQFGFGGRLVSFKPGGVTLRSSLVPHRPQPYPCTAPLGHSVLSCACYSLSRVVLHAS
jgi:hypothetical protein